MTALLLQLLSIALLRYRLAPRCVCRHVTLIVLLSVLYQRISSLLLEIPSIQAWDIYRIGVQPRFVASATLIMSSAMLGMTITYLLTRPERSAPPVDAKNIRAIITALDWRWLACVCAPLAALT